MTKRNSSLTHLPDIYQVIKPELTQVEKQLKKATNSSIQIISDIGNYIFREKGKRLRPALLILSSKLLGYHGKEIIRFASVVEFIHTASLIHDDIVDNSSLRRGKEAIHSKWGSNVTVLLGDYLYILSIKLSLTNDNSRIIQTLSEISTQMIEGEILEFHENWNFDLNEENYLEIIKKKTGSLFAGSCKIGAMLAQADSDQEKALNDFGLNAGMAFQIIDDLLDFTSDEKTLGKPVLSDLKEGKITLPLIFTLKNNQKEKDKIIQLIKDKKWKKINTREIINTVAQNGALEYTYQKAREYIDKAKEKIELFSDSIYKKTLLSITDYIIERNK
ncbi:MAG: polyprenyl synthetase family protein [Candidatus Aminicenantia bacterium]